MKHLNELFAEKNQMVLKGQIVEAVEKFFSDDVKTVDFTGKKANNKMESLEGQKMTVEAIKKVNEISLHHVAVGDNVTFAEFIFDFDLKDGSRLYWHEIILSEWKNGKIVYEEYYKAL